MGRIMLATSNSTDEEYGGTFVEQASDVAYDNTTSGMTATDVQSAIDEVASQYVVENKASSTINISAGDRGVFTIDVTKQDYTPIGIVGVSLSNNWLVLGSFAVTSSTTTMVVLHNKSSNANETYVTIQVLYKHN